MTPREKSSVSKNVRVAEDTQTGCTSKTHIEHHRITDSISCMIPGKSTNAIWRRDVSQFRCNFAIHPSTDQRNNRHHQKQAPSGRLCDKANRALSQKHLLHIQRPEVQTEVAPM
ncbi:hypothetical protein Trydic_g1561 [Trypoxylus dichotomus]